MLVVGFSAVMMDISNQTIIQSAIRSRFRGRTMSIYGMIAQGGPAVGALGMGLIAGSVGIRLPVLVGACLTLVAGVLALLFRRQIAGTANPAPE
jgi:MFS family permease